MKYLLASLFLFSPMAFGQTVIDYEDGSTYTLEEGENIFVSTQPVFSKKTYNTGAVYFTPVEANTQRDYVASPTDGMEVGSHEWCKAYVPWSEGYTFNMQAWQRFCDTDNDGSYGPGDAGWSEPS
tara:strand:- start:47 stop:421 length:375 start_codon:yes stop_codon:yes gene_type:complete